MHIMHHSEPDVHNRKLDKHADMQQLAPHKAF